MITHDRIVILCILFIGLCCILYGPIKRYFWYLTLKIGREWTFVENCRYPFNVKPSPDYKNTQTEIYSIIDFEGSFIKYRYRHLEYDSDSIYIVHRRDFYRIIKSEGHYIAKSEICVSRKEKPGMVYLTKCYKY